ncbi:hypothetical protein IFT67_12565 [Sphingomonas sp. CFBP 13728]|uniref:hypothetical protein n=1 Tax=Sphingomonas sp. CFBP 13728 TaxID=2775294 RepID=UPI001781ED9B|nr:hypothetical protein [Sphingomonas sp. CFBP 13728]MBD8619755.1 hypothetical protein [Sphingomonas sp. CFBP 13728]
MTTKTKPVFKKFQRFDAQKAAKGVPHTIIDPNENDYGTWTTSLYDPYNKFIKVENDRYERENANNPLAKGKNSGIFAFVQICVQGWEGVVDADDKPIPFSKELAFEYLSDEDNGWFATELIDRSKDVRYYRAVTPAATQEADAGN